MRSLYILLKQYLQAQADAVSRPSLPARAEKYFKTIKSIEQGATRVSAWSLTLVGGSLLAILSDSYVRPDAGLLRSVYLCFIPGWILTGISLYYGMSVSNASILADLYVSNEQQLKGMFSQCNLYYGRQLKFFNWALLIFGIWLVLFVLWWVFGEQPVTSPCKICIS